MRGQPGWVPDLIPIDALIRVIKRLSAVTSVVHAGLPENAGRRPRTTPLNGVVGGGEAEGGPGASSRWVLVEVVVGC